MPHDDPIKVYGYARASSPKNLGTQGSKYSKQELSPHRQAEMIEKRGREICEEHSIGWGKCFMEWASAVKLKYNERPVFKELMQVVQPRDHLVIWRVDRLGGEFFGSMACLEWIQSRRIVIHSIEEFGAVPIDLNSALGRVMVALLAGAKDLTNEHSRKAITQALAWHKRRGLAYGPLLIGKRRVEVNGPSEQAEN